jgi:hypothetical protein
MNSAQRAATLASFEQQRALRGALSEALESTLSDEIGACVSACAPRPRLGHAWWSPTVSVWGCVGGLGVSVNTDAPPLPPSAVQQSQYSKSRMTQTDTILFKTEDTLPGPPKDAVLPIIPAPGPDVPLAAAAVPASPPGTPAPALGAGGSASGRASLDGITQPAAVLQTPAKPAAAGSPAKVPVAASPSPTQGTGSPSLLRPAAKCLVLAHPACKEHRVIRTPGETHVEGPQRLASLAYVAALCCCS